ncbi:MAG: response regulator [Spirochaetes bacterium]|jgi:signal transduction histidine kinase|nr:response regulator [Spirochaetota bacterium]
MKSNITILIVEDDALTAADLQSKLQKLGYGVIAIANSSLSAVSYVKDFDPDIIIMDIQLKGNTDGIETAGYIADQFNIPVIFLTSFSDEEIKHRARTTRPYGYMVKPLDIRVLQSNIDSALYRHSIEQENQALINLKNAAEKANYSKSKFLANMSHELRTPLNSILGFAKLMKMGYDPEEYDNQLKHIVSSGEHLLSLINEILDYMKIHAGKIKFNLVHMNPEPIVADCVKLVEHCANENGITVSCELPDFPITIFADKMRFKQILLNLLSNAVKFTPPGGKVDIRLLEKKGHCYLEVQDNGSGIAKNEQQLIFETFEQISLDSSCDSVGSGLGLAITRILVETHGGMIELESEPGKGSLFRVVLAALHDKSPTKTEEINVKSEYPFVPVDGNILIVEDNNGNRDFLIKYFEKMDQEVISVCDGYECLGLFDTNRASNISLILMDIRMRGLSGIDTARELKKRGIKTPIIAVSAFITEELYNENSKNLFASHLSKPVNINDLNHAISDLFTEKS